MQVKAHLLEKNFEQRTCMSWNKCVFRMKTCYQLYIYLIKLADSNTVTETQSQDIICLFVYIKCFLISKNIFYRFLELLSNLVQNALKLEFPFTLCKVECRTFRLNVYHHSMIVAYFANL